MEKSRKQFSVRIPILAYHRVLPDDAKVDKSVINSPFTLSKEVFYNQMLFLSENSYRTMSLYKLQDLINGRQNGSECLSRDKLIVITFDDGWVDNFDFAFPILKSFKFSATFFIITDRVNSAEYMSWKQSLELQSRNIQVESHTHTHTPLESLSNSEIQWELTHSKNLIEKHLGKQVRFISFPHGSYNKFVLQAAKNTGYSGCGTSNFGHATLSSKIYELPRILIRRNHNISQFAKFCSGSKLTLLKGSIIQKSKDMIKSAVGHERYNDLHEIRYRIKRALA